jgi:hypothetical protein
MSQAEFADWVAFFERYPFDDRSRYVKPAALIAQSMRGGEIRPLLDYLQPPVNDGGFSDADLSTLAAFGLKV